MTYKYSVCARREIFVYEKQASLKFDTCVAFEPAENHKKVRFGNRNYSNKSFHPFEELKIL